MPGVDDTAPANMPAPVMASAPENITNANFSAVNPISKTATMRFSARPRLRSVRKNAGPEAKPMQYTSNSNPNW